MRLEHTAMDEKGFIEKNISVQKMDDGNYLVTAYELPTGKKEERAITMEFTQNGMNALVGGMMAASGNISAMTGNNQEVR